MKKLSKIFLFLLIVCCFELKSIESKTHIKVSNYNTYLKVEDIQDNGFILKLNDGSEWDIKYFGGVWKLLGWGWIEQKQVSHWNIGDIIEIQYPDTGNFTDFFLVLKNLSKNEFAFAYLKQAPSTDYSTCLWVMDFDPNTNSVTLNDGTIWFKTDKNMFGAFFQESPSPSRNFEVRDALTLIRDEGGWCYSDLFLLWNHSTNEMPIVNSIE